MIYIHIKYITFPTVKTIAIFKKVAIVSGKDEKNSVFFAKNAIIAVQSRKAGARSAIFRAALRASWNSRTAKRRRERACAHTAAEKAAHMPKSPAPKKSESAFAAIQTDIAVQAAFAGAPFLPLA